MILFDDSAKRLVGLVTEGGDLVARSDDPQVVLKPTRPIPAGWCHFQLEVEGALRNPRVYLDFGRGFGESWSVGLHPDRERRTYRGMSFLAGPVRRLRLDPSDVPARFRLIDFRVDAIAADSPPHALSRSLLKGLLPDRRLVARCQRFWIGLAGRWTLARQGDRRLANVSVVFSERSHLSGVSVRLNLGGYDKGVIKIALHEPEVNGLRAIRTAEAKIVALEPGEMEHFYWEPVEASQHRFFILRAWLSLAGEDRSARAIPLLADASLIYSPPKGYDSLPQAVLFSPVSQCNLNCIHCISRPTRARSRFASESVWDAVREVTHGRRFVHLGTDYSGDILFDERRYPGTLTRLIALDASFRIDTNANCLDDDIIEMLLASRLKEINFSIDSMDPTVYGKVRHGSIPLAEVLGKIARFMSRKREARKEIHTIISFVLMKSNAATIKPALAFAGENGIDHVLVTPLMAFTEDMVKEIFVWDEIAFAALREELAGEATRLGVALAMEAPVSRWREDDIHAPCEIPWATAVFTANGDVMACCMPGTVMGNLNEQSLDQIWNGPKFAAFRMRVNSTDPPASCRNCGVSRVRNNRKAYAPVHHALPPRF